jgi:hypothetical protein
MPDDVDKWAERVAIVFANYRERRRTVEGLRVLEEQLGAHYLNRSVDEARRIESEFWKR